MMQVAPEFQPLFREVGIDADAVFSHPEIRAWRSLDDRENCTLDATLTSGERIRLHIKRFPVSTLRAGHSPADAEVGGLQHLARAGIPTAKLVAWGRVNDGRSFVITEDLAGYAPADKLIAGGVAFDRLLEPTASLTAALHSAGLHHRDLYLCHFFVRLDEPVDVRLIDAARVKPLPGWLTRRRWLVKDLAQFWYSTLEHAITDAQRCAWLDQYAQRLSTDLSVSRLAASLRRKVRQIAAHDARLRACQPRRNVSIPD